MAYDVRRFPLTVGIVSSSRNDSILRIPFASNEQATMAKAIIDVDKELNPQTVKRTLTVEDDHLLACVLSFR